MTDGQTITIADQDELAEHLVQVPGARREGRGVRGTASRRGSAQRPAVGGLPLAAADTLVMTGIVNGAERWASPNGSTVEYRAPHGTLRFHAWKRKTFFGYWSMGAEISTSGTDFEAAVIDSHYYMSVSAPCQVVRVDQDSDRNDDYLDEYEWGWHAQQPERVASLCRAQWGHARFADLVTAGDGCQNYLTDAWPVGFPSDWPSVLKISPSTITFGSLPLGTVGTRTLTIENATGVTVSLSIAAPAAGSHFSWQPFSGTLLNGAKRTVTVQFGPVPQGISQGTLTVTSSAPGSPHRIGLLGKSLGGF
jgi:Abnormal spindle-like microcephaly-assoc'd, ASPM-SPD-2-Hydin